MRKIALIITILIGLLEHILAQGWYYRPIISLQYNTLRTNTNLLQTTYKGLGSGLYDFSQKIGISNIINKKAQNFLIELDFPMISITKLRFKNNIVFTNSGIAIDTIMQHNFYSQLFSSDGSKITLIGINSGIYAIYKLKKIKNSYLKIGLFADYYIAGWHKLIFHEQGIRKMIETNFYKLTSYGLNSFNYGIDLGIRLHQIYLFYQYSLSNLYSNQNIKANIVSYGIYYFLSLNSLRKNKKYIKTKFQ